MRPAFIFPAVSVARSPGELQVSLGSTDGTWSKANCTLLRKSRSRFFAADVCSLLRRRCDAEKRFESSSNFSHEVQVPSMKKRTPAGKGGFGSPKIPASEISEALDDIEEANSDESPGGMTRGFDSSASPKLSAQKISLPERPSAAPSSKTNPPRQPERRPEPSQPLISAEALASVERALQKIFVGALVLFLVDGVFISYEATAKILEWDVPEFLSTLSTQLLFPAFNFTLIAFLVAASIYGYLKIR